jgi:hypothetical protein
MQDHQNMLQQLGINALKSGTSGKVSAPIHPNDEKQIPANKSFDINIFGGSADQCERDDSDIVLPVLHSLGCKQLILKTWR